MVAALDLAEARTDLFPAMAVAEGGSFALPAGQGRAGAGGAGLAEKLRALKDQLGPRGIRCRHEPGRSAPAHEPHCAPGPENHDPCGTELSRAIHYLPSDSPSPPLPSSLPLLFSALPLKSLWLQGSAHSLDTALLGMARAANLSRRLHKEDFDPAESHAKPQQCDDFRKYLSAVLCGDYLAARGKKCDLKAVVSLNGAPCPASACHAEEEGEGKGKEEKLCEESVTEAMDAADNLESRCEAVPVRQVREGSSSSTTTSRPRSGPWDSTTTCSRPPSEPGIGRPDLVD